MKIDIPIDPKQLDKATKLELKNLKKENNKLLYKVGILSKACDSFSEEIGRLREEVSRMDEVYQACRTIAKEFKNIVK